MFSLWSFQRHIFGHDEVETPHLWLHRCWLRIFELDRWPPEGFRCQWGECGLGWFHEDTWVWGDSEIMMPINSRPPLNPKLQSSAETSSTKKRDNNPRTRETRLTDHARPHRWAFLQPPTVTTECIPVPVPKKPKCPLSIFMYLQLEKEFIIQSIAGEDAYPRQRCWGFRQIKLSPDCYFGPDKKEKRKNRSSTARYVGFLELSRTIDSRWAKISRGKLANFLSWVDMWLPFLLPPRARIKECYWWSLPSMKKKMATSRQDCYHQIHFSLKYAKMEKSEKETSTILSEVFETTWQATNIAPLQQRSKERKIVTAWSGALYLSRYLYYIFVRLQMMIAGCCWESDVVWKGIKQI